MSNKKPLKNMRKNIIIHWLACIGKRDLVVLAIRGLVSAFSFDASKSLLLAAWTGIQPMPLVRHIRQFDSYCRNLKLILLNAGWFSFLHPLLNNTFMVFPKTILVGPFAFRICVTSCSGSYSAISYGN
jgi:hypothetical protein